MYKVLLVDDESPALRLMQTIIEKYLKTDYAVTAACLSGESALKEMAERPVDLLMTDISMPGMDGIALALKARESYPDLRIVIISGYAEFDYARGAIQAGADDYILKPVSIPRVTETLEKVKKRLDEEIPQKNAQLLGDLMAGRQVDQKRLSARFGDAPHNFALVRWGNLPGAANAPWNAAPLVHAAPPLMALRGRDEDEQLLFMPVAPSVHFQAAVKAYVARQRACPTWTIIFCRDSAPLTAMPGFVRRASQVMEQTLSIGRHQYLFADSAPRGGNTPRIAGATLKKLEHFIQDNNAKMIKDIFLSLAVDWEKRQLPQFSVNTLVQQVVNVALVNQSSLALNQASVLRDMRELFRYAASYGDLMASLYALLFDDTVPHDRKFSAEDLYGQALQYIHEKYASPVSIGNICADIGISQTYLSRLFRKYGNTTFGAYLTKYRMDCAKALIREHPDILLRDVAACVGYDDSSYFSKVFHQITGYTPSQWALQARPGESEQSAAKNEEG